MIHAHKKKPLFLICFSGLLSLIFFLPSCNSTSPKLVYFQGIRMQMPYTIQIGDSISNQQEEKITALLEEVFSEIDTLYNHWNPSSELSKLNQHHSLEGFSISEELKEILLLARTYFERTNGRFDPTLGEAISEWKQALRQGNLPVSHNKEIQYPGFEQIEILGNMLYKKNPKMMFDLDGMIKGFAVDRITLKLQQLGLQNFYVEWAGEIATRGYHPTKRHWQILIDGTDQIVFLKDKALATSGVNGQVWEIDGTFYTHIIDPQTTRPLQGQHVIAKVTVEANYCMEADALATSMMVCSSQKEVEECIQRYTTQNPNIRIWVQYAKKDNLL